MTDRDGPDRCPGLLRPFVAADGGIVRLRIPGGRLPAATLSELSRIATEFGAPVVQLTSRANLQLRGLPVPVPVALTDRIAAIGLLPSASHERVRNILAAPLAGAAAASVVAELDAAIMAEPGLAGLPGRFLWAVSDESGSVLGEPWDIAYVAEKQGTGMVLVGDWGVSVRRADAVPVMLDRARQFLAHRPDETTWNVRDLPAQSPVFAGMAPYRAPVAPPLRPGPAGEHLVVGVPLGLLRPGQADALAAQGGELVVTPWRSVVVPGGAVAGHRIEARLSAAGLVTEPESPWARLSACVGAPFCRRTDTATLDLATAATEQLGGDGPWIHVVGCERGCGAPAGEHVAVVAPRQVQDLLSAAGAGR